MSNIKLSDNCNLELSTQSKITSDYQVDYIIFKKKLTYIKDEIKKIDNLINEQNLKIQQKKLEKETNNIGKCSPTNTNYSCSTQCNNIYNPNNKDPKTTGKIIPCENNNIFNTIKKTINNVIQTSDNNLNLNNNCECSVPKYNDLDILNKELENLNLQKAQLMQKYNEVNNPPKTPILALACCSNNITCKDGNCGSLFDDCKIKESFEANLADNNNFFLPNNIGSFILLIILILFILLQRK
jgi:hypothetical protein